LDCLDLEREPGDDVVGELDGGLLVAGVVDAQHPQPSAVVDGGVLVVLLAPGPGSRGRGLSGSRLCWCGGDGGDELHVDLNVVAGQLLLLPLPPPVLRLVPLPGRQPVHPPALEDPPHPESLIWMSWYRFRYIAIFAGPK